jgi:hypothetical protein
MKDEDAKKEIPEITDSQRDYLAKATEQYQERKKIVFAVKERTAVAVVWAIIGGAALIVVEWLKIKIGWGGK